MKLFKLFTSCLLLAIVALFFWQNLPAFQAPVPFQLNLYLRQPWSWTLSQCTLLVFPWSWVSSSAFGLMLKPYFRIRRLLAQERKGKEQESSPKSMATST